MNNSKSLVKEYVDEFSIKEFNTTIKFTAVMEEVLLTLLALFILTGNTEMTDIVNELGRLLSRSPNAIGTALKALSQLNLIAYCRKGQGMIVKINLENAFLTSLLVRFFGINSGIYASESLGIPLENVVGFIPSDNDYRKALEFFKEKNELVKSKIKEYQEWLNWLEEIEQLEQLAKIKDKRQIIATNSSNPFIELASKIVSAIDYKQSLQLAKLTREEITPIISDSLFQNRAIPPWNESIFLKQQTSQLIIDFEE